ncbi:MAG TPA: hypothetical protein VH639_10375 [Bryobacteraceae bacterium]|jgi:hypothetical protein
MLEVAAAYLLSSVLILCVLCLGSLIGFIAIRVNSERFPLYLFLIGAILIGIAGLEKMGWAVRPWAVGSPAQQFDDLLFRIVWLAGFGFIFTGWAAQYRMRRRSAAESQEAVPDSIQRAPTPKVVTIRERPEAATPSIRAGFDPMPAA